MSILCQHQTVGEVTQGSDTLLLVPCTSKIVFSFVHCILCLLPCIAILLSVHEVFPYDKVWMCIGAYQITQKKSQVGVSSRGISGK